MKKVFYFIFLTVALTGCSKDELEGSAISENLESEIISGKKMVNFEDHDEFISEYKDLSKLETQKQFEDWAKDKGHIPLLSKFDSINKVNDSLGIIYSNPILSIVNTDGEFTIGKKVIRLINGTFYLREGFKNKSTARKESIDEKIRKRAEIYGGIKNLAPNRNAISTKEVMENANRSLTYSYEINNGDARFLVDLYNETIYAANGDIETSQMFLRSRMDYESCSFWRCKWKNDSTTRRNIDIDIDIPSVHWQSYVEDEISVGGITGIYTILLADYDFQYPYTYHTNFGVSLGSTVTTRLTSNFIEPIWELNIGWYGID